VLGGVVGYIIGYVYSDFFFSNLTWVFDSDQLNEIVGWMEEWGGIIVLISGFSPIPYKVFTIASGITGLAFVPFLVASFIGRGLRFFLIGFIVIRGGENIEQKIRKNAEVLGWVTVLILILYFSFTFLDK
jgi:membrane protein YqaA with SNARE-associated domain